MLYGTRARTGNVTPLGTTFDRVLASVRARRVSYWPEDCAGPWR
jgi:hypothetical protein